LMPWFVERLMLSFVECRPSTPCRRSSSAARGTRAVYRDVTRAAHAVVRRVPPKHPIPPFVECRPRNEGGVSRRRRVVADLSKPPPLVPCRSATPMTPSRVGASCLTVFMIEIDARHQAYEVSDLDAGTLLGFVAEDRVRQLKADRRRLRLAYQWVVLNPPTPESPARSEERRVGKGCGSRRAT